MFCLVGFVGLYVDEFAPFFACCEDYHSVYECEECVVFAHSYVEAGMVLSAALTFDDVAGTAV